MFLFPMGRNQFHILLRAVADVSKGQTVIPYQGEDPTRPIQGIRHHFGPGEIRCITISESSITILISRGRSNCGITDCRRSYNTY